MTDASKRYYITTPIYYVNGLPHIGTATTTLLADATSRYRRLRGDKPFFLTGTDENARKVTDAATKAGKEPQAFVDEVSDRFVKTWQFLNCDYDVFFRTTEARHTRVVQEIFERLRASGNVYLGTYEGWYSVADETFFRDTDVDEEKKIARETGAPVERVQEEAYFFRLSAYGDRLKEYIHAHPDFLQPETRKNEVLAFIEQGLRDINITQNRSGWGINVPGEPNRVIYVWFDALINYLAATGWPEAGWETLWPADVHLMGKEIYTRFHATLWPAMLFALDLPLPKHVVGHGWWLIGGEKGAKSKGNIPLPEEVVASLVTRSGAPEAICIDALRYYLLRDIRFTDDAEYSDDILVSRFNADLGNDLGNVLNRLLAAQYHNGVIPIPRSHDAGLAAVAAQTVRGYEAALERFDWGTALQAVWILLSEVNKFLAERAPWKLAKAGDTEGVGDAVYNALEAVRLAAYLLSPAMPHVAAAIGKQLGVTEITPEGSWGTATQFGGLVSGTPTGTPVALFPRIQKQPAAAPTPAAPKKEKPVISETVTPGASVAPQPADAVPSDTITIDDFLRVQLRVADILSAERIPGAKKLLQLQIRVGEGDERQLVAGIAETYAPEDLIGRQIVVVANLQPAVIRGVQSQGMLLAATDELGRAILLKPDNTVLSGAKVK